MPPKLLLICALIVAAVFGAPHCSAQATPAAHVPFPEINDWKSLKITLRRTTCFGACPNYLVEIFGDGTVVYTGYSLVAVEGEQRGHISQDGVKELVDLFRRADYFSLNDKYYANASDGPTYTTSISFDAHSKTVVDYFGALMHMPHTVTDLEEGIDRIAETAKWVKSSAQKPKH